MKSGSPKIPDRPKKVRIWSRRFTPDLLKPMTLATELIEEMPDTKEIARFHLGNKRYVVVCLFKGDLKVHIRQYSIAGYPTTKGICLTSSRWATLMTRINAIEGVFKRWLLRKSNVLDTSEHLGGNVCVTACDMRMTVNIHEYSTNNSTDVKARKMGINLRICEWRNLTRLSRNITNSCVELANAVPCRYQASHRDITVLNQCVECNPNGYIIVL